MDDTEHNDNETEQEHVPEAFLFVRFDQLLCIVGLTIVLCSVITNNAWQYAHWVLLSVVVIVAIASLIARRQMRKFVRKHGEVEIRFTFSYDASRPKKNILFREVSELIDTAIDRIADGREQVDP